MSDFDFDKLMRGDSGPSAKDVMVEVRPKSGSRHVLTIRGDRVVAVGYRVRRRSGSKQPEEASFGLEVAPIWDQFSPQICFTARAVIEFWEAAGRPKKGPVVPRGNSMKGGKC